MPLAAPGQLASQAYADATDSAERCINLIATWGMNCFSEVFGRGIVAPGDSHSHLLFKLGRSRGFPPGGSESLADANGVRMIATQEPRETR